MHFGIVDSAIRADGEDEGEDDGDDAEKQTSNNGRTRRCKPNN
jgi:hypothetical protein